MANITLNYKGLTGKRGSVTIDNGQTLLQLIDFIRLDEDPTLLVLTNADYDLAVERDTSITDGNNGSDTLLAAGIVDGDNIICIDEPGGTKEERQERKGRIASVNRYREGKATRNWNKNRLPNPYEGNAYNADDDENTGPLQAGRPWT